MKELTPSRKLIVFGRLKTFVRNGLMTRYRVDIAHQFAAQKDALQGKALITQGDYDSVLFAGDVPQKFRSFILQQMERERPDYDKLTIVVMTDQQSYGSWLSLSPRAGVEEIAQRFGFAQRGKPAQIIVVANTKGGVGKSHVASNLVTMLAEAGKNVVILEDDWSTRSVKEMMGVADTEKMSANLVADIEAADGLVTPELLEKYLVKSFGVNCLIGPPDILTQFAVTPDIAREIIAVLGFDLGVDFVVIDSPPDFLNSSSFTLSLLRNSQNAVSPPLILVPIVPETTIVRSARDTLTVVTSLGHPKEKVWPIINCTKGEHNPDMLRGNKNLWRSPAAIIPYCLDAQFVGDRHRPMVAGKPGGWLGRSWKRLLGVADIAHVRVAYRDLAASVVEYTENGGVHD